MRKKFILPIIISLLVFIVISITFIINNKNSYSISITNNTSLTISNLTLKFKPGKILSENFELNPKETIKYDIDTSNIAGETSLVLLFKDDTNTLHEEYINGYLEKNFTGKSKVLIDTDNDNDNDNDNNIFFSIK